MNARHTEMFDASRMGSRALEWLTGGSSGAFVLDAPLSGVLQRLVGAWICEVGLRVDLRARRTGAIAARVRQLLDQRPADECRKNLAACDSALVLVSALLLRRTGTPSRNLDAFLGQLVNALDSDLRGADGNLFAVRYLLSRDAWCAAPKPPGIAAPSRRSNLLELTPAEVERCCIEVSAATAYGERKLRDARRTREIVAVLPIWSLYFARIYDLSRAALVLRTMNDASLQRCAAFADVARFLASQQLAAGYFGFFGADRRPDGADERTMVEQVYLPTTVASLWTLAEVTSSRFRLFRPPSGCSAAASVNEVATC